MMLFLLLAEAGAEGPTFTAEQLGVWVAILFFVVGGGLGIKRLSQKPIEPKDPQTTQEVSPAATKAELNSLKADLSERLDKIEEDLEGQRDVARDAQGKVHGRIDKVAESLSEVKGELHQMNLNLRLLLERSIKPSGR